MNPALAITAFTATSCLGAGVAAHRAALREARSGLKPCDFLGHHLPTWIGEVAGLDQTRLPAILSRYDCRNNRLAELSLAQDGFAEAVLAARERHGPDRIGVWLGTSTSGMLEIELAYARRSPPDGPLPDDFHYAETHNTFSLGDYVRRRFDLQGPAVVISAACASGAKVFASARRAIAAGLVDAAVVGGVDTLCLTTLYGFKSLELLSTQPCRPYDANRDGISIGEAGGFALLEAASTEARARAGGLLLLGTGESSDAHHMSSPHPEGEGARLAMASALADAGLQTHDIDYVNLHGTATPSNDRAEDLAVMRLFGDRVPVSSTKGAHGHTLGAAGALEAVIGLLSLQEGLIPGGLNLQQRDPELHADYRSADEVRPLRRVMSNSFGFGGSNSALIVGREAA